MYDFLLLPIPLGLVMIALVLSLIPAIVLGSSVSALWRRIPFVPGDTRCGPSLSDEVEKAAAGIQAEYDDLGERLAAQADLLKHLATNQKMMIDVAAAKDDEQLRYRAHVQDCINDLRARVGVADA